MSMTGNENEKEQEAPPPPDQESDTSSDDARDELNLTQSPNTSRRPSIKNT